jgi:AAA+ superfamily predicted ATPase
MIPWRRRSRDKPVNVDVVPRRAEIAIGDAVPRQSTAIADSPYPRAWAHLEQELEWLDCLIRARVTAASRKERDPLAGLQGLVISEGEVADLLAPGQAPAPEAVDLVRRAARMREQIDARLARTRSENVLLPLPYLARLFQLTRGEERVLLIGLAAEVHRRYDKLFSYLNDDVTRKRPSVELALDLVCDSTVERIAARSLFDPTSPLLRYRLIQLFETEPSQPLRARSFALDDRIAGYLLGGQGVDPLIADRIRWLQPGDASDMAPADAGLLAELRASARAYFGADAEARPNVVLHLRGAYGTGRRDLAAAIGGELGLPLLLIDAARIARAGLPLADSLWRAARESLLGPAVLVVEGFDALLQEDAEAQRSLQTLLEVVPQFCRCAVLIGERRFTPAERLGETVFVQLEMPSCDEVVLARWWQERAERVHPSIDGVALRSLAGRFHFTPGRIDYALRVAYASALWRSPTDVAVTEADVHRACRALSSTALNGLARRIDPRHDWRDIVLPPDQLKDVKSIADRVRNRHVVMGEWGFGRKLSLGKGVSALFAGPPGTGKTMAAEVVANDLGFELYKIDLSQIVSKYIGETEKNLDRVFAAAERGSAILFFDEADALFGKRSEVRDSHDRYANVEISYLLQKMEEYEGVAVLATNLRRHMDEAFLRRLQFVIEFPFPNRDEREAIWRVTLPSELPLDADVDLGVLARDVRLAGGGIKNVCLSAGHLAAADGGAVTMAHFWEASRREYEKLGRSFSAQSAVEAAP